ncbi:MAG: hypothetical protein CYG60_24530 [Actinobacteria bacterium]|nr:terminase large subunit [Actinomycetota bacterium]PLS82380.1 MAG: hypothetical protein CYG60_24530 [Actinomycetota bacterium]
MSGLRNDLRLALDRVAFARAAGLFNPDPWQTAVLRSRRKQKILNTSRQIGKSTVISGLCLHKALYTPESNTYVFAPTEKQAKETFAKIARFYRAYVERDPTDALRSAVSYEKDPIRNVNKMGLKLPNGSKISAMPGTDASSRGFTADLLIIDEAAFARNAFYDAIRPSLAVSNGDVILASTPNGKRGFFYGEWSEGDDWERFEVPANLCPRITDAFLRAELKRMGERHYLQEYFCQFAQAEDSVFQTEVIADAFGDEDVLPLWDD